MRALLFADQAGPGLAPLTDRTCLALLPVAGKPLVDHALDLLEAAGNRERNSNFTEVFSNRKAARRAAGMAQVGCSDGHFLAAIGRCHGLPTLVGFVVERLRVGKNVVPS